MSQIHNNYMLLQMPAKRAKGMVIAAATFRG